MKNLIELKNVTKRFGGITALNRASLNVNSGEVVGLIGDNGAGKSTLIKTLVGVYSPDEGDIFIKNKKQFHENCFYFFAEFCSINIPLLRELILSHLYQTLLLPLLFF